MSDTEQHWTLQSLLKHIEKTPHSALFFTPPQCSENAQSWFFSGEGNYTTACSISELEALLKTLDDAEFSSYSYAYFTYEAGCLLQDIPYCQNENQVYAAFFSADKNAAVCLSSQEITESYRTDKCSGEIAHFSKRIFSEKYNETIERILHLIKKGETYQVNFTLQADFDLFGSVADVFISLLFSQSAPYTALIHDGDSYIVSLSPELFFERTKDRIRCKPMKGTIRRGINLEQDEILARTLFESEKNRAENIMIVDLIRNDIHAIDPSIQTTTYPLYEIERYETVYQMTSTVQSQLKRHLPFSKIFTTLFPCGSITGAPKINTMKIIQQLEECPRGIYTGALILFTPEKTVSNIPIRTAIIDTRSNKGTIGIGSGIVWDSSPQDEFSEIEQKGRFLTNPIPPFYLFETMLFEKGRIFLFEEHLQRLKQAAAFFLFVFDEYKIRSMIKSVISNFNSSSPYRIKCSLHKWGFCEIEFNTFTENISEPIDIILSDKSTDKNNRFSYFKTSLRMLYDNERAAAQSNGFFEVIFLNENRHVSEGSITNIFIKKDNHWFTPPISSGILDGIYRSFFMKQYAVKEKVLLTEDLVTADYIVLTNSLRKVIPVRSISNKNGVMKVFDICINGQHFTV
jgi:para-aminobenzoate synthetase / 4-amino-4-deoxychorismate lyase